MRLASVVAENPACILALAGVMRITGVRARWCDPALDGAELEREVTPSELLKAATSRLNQIASWPDDAEEEWWLAYARRTDLDAETQATIETLGSLARDGEWKHSQWRMVQGQQRWIRMIRQALTQIDAAAITAWLQSTHWPRDAYMGMSGVDCSAYRPAALNWTSDTAKQSRGSPVSLWLMWEGMHLLPSVSGNTLGWGDRMHVRWPIWTASASIDWLRTIWWSEWLMRDLDSPSIPVGECGEFVSPRAVLREQGVVHVYESRRSLQPPPYSWRLNAGMPI